MKKRKLKHRDVNWLSFNARVLQEAASEATPLFERLKFLAIFSSNLDEFFKVRIATLRQLKDVDKALRKRLAVKGSKTLRRILDTVKAQQQRFGEIIIQTLTDLKDHGIFILRLGELNEDQKNHLEKLFDQNIQQHCIARTPENFGELTDGGLYLITEYGDHELVAVNIPSKELGRFQPVPGEGHNFVFIDDAVKLNLHKVLALEQPINSYCIKISRDAQLYLEDDYTNTELVEKIYNSLNKRETGQPTRLLYDKNMPDTLLARLRDSLELGEVDLFPGGVYHNMSDFFGFPFPDGFDRLNYENREPLPHPVLNQTDDIFRTIAQGDRLVHFPYQDFASVENFISAAAEDPAVNSIKITLYRVAKKSALTDSLLLALKNGKDVMVFIEAQARFDEENNIYWGRVLTEHGAKVLYSIPNIKVHSKIALVQRKEASGLKGYAYIGTGNFNAKTAKIYCDHGLFTAHEQITNDLLQVFGVLERTLIIPKLKRLLVSPFTTRTKFLELIQNEIDNAKAGQKAAITIKMNSLEDTRMIEALYRASEAGVHVKLLIRGFSRLINRNGNLLEPSEVPIKITSIIDRYLEHGRIYHFHNQGKELMYIGSADWMTRNLDRRIEVLTPILDTEIFNELKDILEIQLSDNVKARVINPMDNNEMVQIKNGEAPIRSQYAIYDYLNTKLHAEN